MKLVRVPAVLAFVGLASLSCNGVSGTLTSTATPLGTWTFSPTRCTATSDQLVLSSRADPLRYLSIERVPATQVVGANDAVAPSILAPQVPPVRLTILALNAGEGAPLVIPASQCRVLSFQASGSFSTRINGGPRVNSYSGTADIDCPYPDAAHRFAGHFDFTCYEE
jgi:hypothetical protein